jgi:hypothetical protein
MLGISDGYYQSHEDKVLFGTGQQGSGASPHGSLLVLFLWMTLKMD